MDGNQLTLEVNGILISETNTVLLTKLIPLEHTHMYHISRHLENEMRVTTWNQCRNMVENCPKQKCAIICNCLVKIW